MLMMTDELKVSNRLFTILLIFIFSFSHIEEYLTAAGIGFDSTDDDDDEMITKSLT